MVLTTIYIAQHHGEVLELCPSTHPGQNMCASLVLAPLPSAYVMIDVIGVLIGTMEEGCVQTNLQIYLADGSVSETRLYPQAWQGVAFGHLARILIVAEECEVIYLHTQSTHHGGIYMIVADGEAVPHLCSCG